MPIRGFTMYHVWILNRWPYNKPYLFVYGVTLATAKYFRRSMRASGYNAVIV